MSQTETAEQAPHAAEAAPNAPGPAADLEPATEGRFANDLGRRKIGLIAASAAAGALVVAFLTARSSVSGPQGHESETVSLRVRPRKVAWRYLASLGLWEASRRRTAYTVTDRRVLVESGLLHRQAHAIPLSGVRDVVVRTGRWQGVVAIRPVAGTDEVLIGPLRTPVAQQLGTAIARAVHDAG